jgi:hypothetical protein
MSGCGRTNLPIRCVAREQDCGPPRTLANMRANGVRVVIATCEACGHKADVNVMPCPMAIRAGRTSSESPRAAITLAALLHLGQPATRDLAVAARSRVMAGVGLFGVKFVRLSLWRAGPKRTPEPSRRPRSNPPSTPSSDWCPSSPIPQAARTASRPGPAEATVDEQVDNRMLGEIAFVAVARG